MRMLLIIGLGIVGCGESQPEELWLTEDFYEWHCDDAGSVIVTTETYESRESGLHYLIAEAQTYDGKNWKRHLTNPEPGVSSHWETEIPLGSLGYECTSPPNTTDVVGVTLTAWVDPATWSGALFGD